MGNEPTLYFGDVDVDGWVLQLQQKLDEKGQSPGQHDGWFGTNTHRAVEHFQGANAQEPHNLKQDGIVGNATWAALMDRDPEPGGINNGPHGDTRQGHHGGNQGSGQTGGGATTQFGEVTFDGEPDVTDGQVKIGVEITNTTDVVLTAYAEFDGQTLAQSQAVPASASGSYVLPIQLPQASQYAVTVWAEIDGGAAHSVSESKTVVVPASGGM